MVRSAALLGALGLSLLSACESSVKVGPQAVAGLTPDGTIDMQEVQAAFLASGGGGNGTLYYRGAPYPFTAGLGSATSVHRRSAPRARSTS